MVIKIFKSTPDPRRKTGFTPLRIYYHIVNYIYLSLFDCCSGYPFWVDNSFSLSGRLISVFGLFSVRPLLFLVSNQISGVFIYLYLHSFSRSESGPALAPDRRMSLTEYFQPTCSQLSAEYPPTLGILLAFLPLHFLTRLLIRVKRISKSPGFPAKKEDAAGIPPADLVYNQITF